MHRAIFISGRKLLLIIITLCFVIGYSQDVYNIDSLEFALKNVENKPEKIVLLQELSKATQVADPTKGLDYANQAYEVAKKSGIDSLEVLSLLYLADLNSTQSNIKVSINYLNKVIEKANDYHLYYYEAFASRKLGMIYQSLGNYEDAINYIFKSLRITENIDDQFGVSESFSYLGSVYSDQGNLEKAYDYYFKSLNIATKIKNEVGLARGYNNIATIHGLNKEYGKAKKYTTKALRINEKAANINWQIINHLNLGYLNEELSIPDTAQYHFQKALKLTKQTKDSLTITKCYVSSGSYFRTISDFETAYDYLILGLKLARYHGFMEEIKYASEELRSLFISQKDTANAYIYNRIYQNVKDSLDFINDESLLAKLELQYDLEKTKQKDKIRQQKLRFNTIIIVVVLVFVILLMFFLVNRQRIVIKKKALEKARLEDKIKHKDKELVINAMALIKQNELMLNNYNKLLETKQSAIKEDTREAIQQVAKSLRKNTMDNTIHELELRFKEVHAEFYEKLMDSYPDLTPGEQRLCAFLKLNMSSKEISSITGQTIGTLENARYRLRKKLGINNSDINLVTFISRL